MEIDPSIHESLFRDFSEFITTVGFPTESQQRLFQVFGHDDSKDPICLTYVGICEEKLCSANMSSGASIIDAERVDA